MADAAVLGAGSWGTTFAKALADGGAETVLWARRPEAAREIDEARRNTRYLPGITLPASLHATSDIREALAGASQVYLAVPSQQLRQLLGEHGSAIEPDAPIVSLMKGVEAGSRLRMSQVVEQELQIDPARIAVVSGPNLALEIAQEHPTAAVVSSTSAETARAIAKRARNDYFHSFINTDVIGTEFGAVRETMRGLAGLGDLIATCGENTKASIITRGLAEVTDFAVAHGAERETMRGLAGLGDLIATCGSPLSRNFTAGRLLGMGYSRTDVVARMEQVAEGLASVDPVTQLAAAKGLRMPILEQVKLVLDGRMDPRDIAPHLTTDDEPIEE